MGTRSDYFDWAPEIQEASDAAIKGIWERDLQPLVAYLRSGMPIDQYWRDTLADAIEGKHYGLRLEVRAVSGRRGRPKSPSRGIANHKRQMKIGQFIEEQISLNGPGGHDAAIAAAVACQELGLRGKDAARRAEEALAYSRAWVSLPEGEDPGDLDGAMLYFDDNGALVIAAKK